MSYSNLGAEAMGQLLLVTLGALVVLGFVLASKGLLLIPAGLLCYWRRDYIKALFNGGEKPPRPPAEETKRWMTAIVATAIPALIVTGIVLAQQNSKHHSSPRDDRTEATVDVPEDWVQACHDRYYHPASDGSDMPNNLFAGADEQTCVDSYQERAPYDPDGTETDSPEESAPGYAGARAYCEAARPGEESLIETCLSGFRQSDGTYIDPSSYP